MKRSSMIVGGVGGGVRRRVGGVRWRVGGVRRWVGGVKFSIGQVTLRRLQNLTATANFQLLVVTATARSLIMLMARGGVISCDTWHHVRQSTNTATARCSRVGGLCYMVSWGASPIRSAAHLSRANWGLRCTINWCRISWHGRTFHRLSWRGAHPGVGDASFHWSASTKMPGTW